MRRLPLFTILVAGLILLVACGEKNAAEPQSETGNNNSPLTAKGSTPPPKGVESGGGAREVYLSAHLVSGPEGSTAAEWGRLLVPENRTNPNSKEIEIPFLRFKTSAPNPGTPTIFLNGGPGEDTLDIAHLFLPFVPELPFDIILVEQRGVAHSRPRLDCPETYDLPLDRPLDWDTLRNEARAQDASCVEFWRAQGRDLSGYNAREMAAGIDDLRQALGYDRINLLGGSFGSHHGLAVLRYHGDSVSRAVLSATSDQQN